MTDRIVLHDIRLEGRHGVNPEERVTPQPFEVDVELELDLGPAGRSDELERTVDYRGVYTTVSEIVTGRSYRLIEALAEAIATEMLGGFRAVDAVVIRVRKPAVQLGGPLDDASVEIRRTRAERR